VLTLVFLSHLNICFFIKKATVKKDEKARSLAILEWFKLCFLLLGLFLGLFFVGFDHPIETDSTR